MSEPSSIRRAIEKGVAFLESAQLPSGEIPIETSSTPEMSGDCVRDPVVFPAALAARALSITSSAARVRSRALDFLLREMEPDGLWRYPSTEHPGRDHIPLDVDDTSIASAALVAAGRRFPDNRALLLANRDRSGLFRTWMVRWWPHPRKTYHFFRDTTANVSDVDAAIEANVVIYLGLCEETRPAIAHMLAVLRANGEMMSTKWYESRFTVWYFFSHALREIAPEAGEMIVPRSDGSPRLLRASLQMVNAIAFIFSRSRTPTAALCRRCCSSASPRFAIWPLSARRNHRSRSSLG